MRMNLRERVAKSIAMDINDMISCGCGALCRIGDLEVVVDNGRVESMMNSSNFRDYENLASLVEDYLDRDCEPDIMDIYKEKREMCL